MIEQRLEAYLDALIHAAGVYLCSARRAKNDFRTEHEGKVYYSWVLEHPSELSDEPPSGKRMRSSFMTDESEVALVKPEVLEFRVQACVVSMLQEYRRILEQEVAA